MTGNPDPDTGLYDDYHKAEDAADDMARELEEPTVLVENLYCHMFRPCTLAEAARYCEEPDAYATVSHPFYPEGGLRDDAPERNQP